MVDRRLPRDVPHLLLYALTATVFLALIVAASTSGTAFGAFNPGWDGTAELRADADERGELELLQETERYESVEPNGTVAFVLAPTEPYDPADADRIAAFLEDGGTLVVADNFAPNAAGADLDADDPGAGADAGSESRAVDAAPHANALLAAVGAQARFRGDLLRDEEHYYRSPAMPIASDVADDPYTADVDRLTLNHATAVEPGAATPIVNTSTVAYLDRDRSGDVSDDEELASYPVVTVEEVGDGRVIAVGDPSVFINVMLDQPDNRAFLDNLLSAHDRTLLDLTRMDAQPPLVRALLAVRGSAGAQLLAGFSLLAAATLATARRPWLSAAARALRRSVTTRVRRRPLDGRRPGDRHRSGDRREDRTPETDVDPDPDALAARLRADHPDWEPERIRRVIAGVMRSDRQKRDDD